MARGSLGDLVSVCYLNDMPTLAPDMSLDRRLDGAVRLKSSFRDRHERRAYIRAFLVAKRLLERPELVARGRRYLERFVKDDPGQRRVYDMWMETLERPVEEIVVELLSDDARGASLRETAPVFVVIPPEQVRALAQSADS
jgi:hypothetical protein